eukprot:Partr_v1_DN27602_c0_g1_i1_m64641 putative domain-containing protein
MEKAKKRTSTRDQAIRKKFAASQSQLSPSTAASAASNAASPSSTAASRKASASLPREAIKPGTVMAMMPSDPLILAQTDSVVQVARSMAGRKTDAVLVVDNLRDMNLVGIVTDKDLAFRCVAEGLDASRTTVGSIMTREPKHIRSDASADEAMGLMMSCHFRHLPVVDDRQIVGLLDITRVLKHIQAKIRNSWGKAEALKVAFADFQDSWRNFSTNVEVSKWFDDWSSKMVEPDLSSVVDFGAVTVPEVGFKTSVRDAVLLMRDCRQTAVIVADSAAGNELAGIFTTKDVCLRVLAPNELDPKSTSVVRVMTPHPDYAVDSMTVQAALKKMHDGHYLHLPVRSEKESRVVGLVDVLGLTYKTMDLLVKQQSLLPSSARVDDSTGAADVAQAGPMWSQFWNVEEEAGSFTGDDSLFAGVESRRHSVASSSIPKPVKSGVGGLVGDGRSARPDSSPDRLSNMTSTAAEATPSTFVFKFRDPFGGTVHRFTHSSISESDNNSQSTNALLLSLLETVLAKCNCVYTNDRESSGLNYSKNHYVLGKFADGKSEGVFGSASGRSPSQSSLGQQSIMFRLAYKDEEGDPVLLVSDDDLVTAVRFARRSGWSRLILILEAISEDQSYVSAPNAVENTSQRAVDDIELENSTVMSGEFVMDGGDGDADFGIPLATIGMAVASVGIIAAGVLLLLKK